ncbi:MAG: TRAP transporter substrate-binding protein [Lautropia sp.]|nr:TRAP transporter substrate-binding protein [Lautropia sp.]
MDRRSALKGGVAASVAAGASTLAAPAISQSRRQWRMVTSWPKNFPGLGVSTENLAKRITTMSGGKLSVKVYAAGEMVPGLQALDAVIEGTAEMAHSAAYYWMNKSPALAFFTGVPYGMTASEMSAWINAMGGQALWDEVYDQFGVQGFLSGNTSIQAGGWFRKELKSVADLKGLRMRAPGIGGQVWQKMGVSTMNLAAGDIFQALQTGTLDAAEFVGPYNDLALGLYQIAKNYYMPSFTEPGLCTELVVNKEKFQALPKELQEVVRTACQAEYESMFATYMANDPRALQTLVNKHGVKVRKFPDDIFEQGAKYSKELIEELRNSKDSLTKKVAQHYIESFNLLRTKTDESDLPYIEARVKYFSFGK